MSVTVLDREMYTEAAAARLLGLPQGTLNYWLEGGERRGRVYRPVIRLEPHGDRAAVTWAEFVEAGLLREYRRKHNVPMAELRAFIDVVRERYGTPYPLADRRPSYPAATCCRTRKRRPDWNPRDSLPAEMHEKPPVILGVFLDPVIQGLDLFLIEEPENPLLELARPFTGNDLDHRRFLRHCFIDDVPQRSVDVLTPVINIVQVQLELHRAVFRTVG
jgi:hypothetical protein